MRRNKAGVFMKPLPAPHVPGNTPGERMSNALRTVLTVSKEDLLKAEARENKKRGKKRAKRSDSV